MTVLEGAGFLMYVRCFRSRVVYGGARGRFRCKDSKGVIQERFRVASQEKLKWMNIDPDVARSMQDVKTEIEFIDLVETEPKQSFRF